MILTPCLSAPRHGSHASFHVSCLSLASLLPGRCPHGGSEIGLHSLERKHSSPVSMQHHHIYADNATDHAPGSHPAIDCDGTEIWWAACGQLSRPFFQL